jgi:hypothetical protein
MTNNQRTPSDSGPQALQRALEAPMEQTLKMQKSAAQMFMNGMELGYWAQDQGLDLTRDFFQNYIHTVEDAVQNTGQFAEQGMEFQQAAMQQTQQGFQQPRGRIPAQQGTHQPRGIQRQQYAQQPQQQYPQQSQQYPQSPPQQQQYAQQPQSPPPQQGRSFQQSQSQPQGFQQSLPQQTRNYGTGQTTTQPQASRQTGTATTTGPEETTPETDTLTQETQ